VRLRDDPDFRRYWWSRVLSTGGTSVTLVALPVLVFRLTGSTLLTGLVSALEAAPYLLFGLLAGALSDRLDRRRIMVGADVVDAVLLGSVPLAQWAGVLTLPHVMVVAFLGPAVAVFFDGSNFGALPVLVGRDRIAVANAAVSGAATAAELVTPALVGVSLAVLQPASLLLGDALSFVASALLVRGIVRSLNGVHRQPSQPSAPAVGLWRDIREGLAFVVRHPGVRTMTIVGTLQCLAGGSFVALDVVWCARVLQVGTSGWRFGSVFSAWSVGAIVASVALPRLLARIDAATITLLALPWAAALAVVTPLQTHWVLGAGALLLWSCGYTLVAVNSISYRQQVTPEHLLGRVNTAGRMLSWGVGWTLGALVGGVLGGWIGVRPAMLAMGSLEAVAAVVAWTSALRRGGRDSRGIDGDEARSGHGQNSTVANLVCSTNPTEA
jgi:MFS family permease